MHRRNQQPPIKGKHMTIYTKRQSTTKRITKSDCAIIVKWLRENMLNGVIVRRCGVEFGLDFAGMLHATENRDSDLYRWLKGCTILKTTIDSLVSDLFYAN
ncbi:MAG: hypothetical protein ACR2NF_10930 [Pirellulales bacterium]